MTLEDLLRTKKKCINGVSKREVEVPLTFVVDIGQEREDGLHFYIHPADENGETLDFLVKGNELTPL